MKSEKIKAPFGVKDSELKGWEYTIPEGMEAVIKDGKIVVRKRESEDEMIRKTLLRCCDDWEKGQFGCMAKEDVPAIRAYLEKQKDQEDCNKLYECISKSEWFKKAYEGKSLGCDYDQKEQEPLEWSEEDKEMLKKTLDNLEELAQKYGENYGKVGKCMEWIESFSEKFNLQPRQEWSEEDEYCRNQLIVFCENCMQQDSAAIRCANWLKSLKDRVQPQSKQEWSEEDEKRFSDVLSGLKYTFEDLTDKKSVDSAKDIQEAFDWMQERYKSLRPQPHTVSIKDTIKFGNLEYERGVKGGIQSEKSRQWKPSEEHIRVLLKANPVNLMPEELAVYNSLCKDIQKLI